jgi:hypothetical protein
MRDLMKIVEGAEDTTPLDANIGAFPIKNLSKAFHIGTLDITKKGNDSYEGAGVSISLDPHRWGMIARIGFTPLWQCEKSSGAFLDRKAVTPEQCNLMAQWAVSQGLAEITTDVPRRNGNAWHGYVCTPAMATRMMVRRADGSYIPIAYAEDVLGLDGVWWHQRFTGTDGPRGVIVPSKISTWTWTKIRDED